MHVAAASGADEGAIDLVVGGFYEAVTASDGWTAAVDALVKLLGGFDGQLLLLGRESGAFFGEPRPSSLMGQEAYLTHWSAYDVRRMVVERQPIGTMIACNQHFAEDYVRHNAFYQEFLVPHEWRFAAGGRVMVAADVTAYVAVHRSPRQGPFEPQELGVLSQLAPHLGRALRLHSDLAQIRDVGQALEVALNQLALGAIVADALGRVVALNHAAEVILAASDGLALRRGTVAAGRTREETALLRLLSEATHGGTRARGGALSVPRPSGRRPYALEVMPLPAWSPACSSWQRPLALMLVTDPEKRPAPLGRRLIDLFGLTPAEARLAVELAKGGRLEDIAAKHGVRMPTVRSQLRALLMKTETHRQSELIGLLARLPATAARGCP